MNLYLIIKRLLLPSENPPRHFYKKAPVIFVIQPALHHLSATQKEKTIRCKNYTRTHRLLPSTLGHPGLCPGRRHTTRRRGRPQPPPLPISTHPPPRPYLSPLTAPVAALERIASTLVHPGLCPGRCHTTRRRGRPQPPLLSISTHPPPRPYLCPLAAPVSALEHSFWIKSTRQLQ